MPYKSNMVGSSRESMNARSTTYPFFLNGIFCITSIRHHWRMLMGGSTTGSDIEYFVLSFLNKIVSSRKNR